MVVNVSIPWCYTYVSGRSFTLQAEVISKKKECGGRCDYYLVIGGRQEDENSLSNLPQYKFFDNQGLNKHGLSVRKSFYNQVKIEDKLIIRGLKSDISWNIRSYEIDKRE